MTNHEELLARSEAGRQARAFVDSTAYQATIADRRDALRDAILALKPSEKDRFVIFRAALCAVEEMDNALAAIVADGDAARVEVEEGKKIITNVGRVL